MFGRKQAPHGRKESQQRQGCWGYSTIDFFATSFSFLQALSSFFVSQFGFFAASLLFLSSFSLFFAESVSFFAASLLFFAVSVGFLSSSFLLLKEAMKSSYFIV
jgi:hypothetical protein